MINIEGPGPCNDVSNIAGPRPKNDHIDFTGNSKSQIYFKLILTRVVLHKVQILHLRFWGGQRN